MSERTQAQLVVAVAVVRLKLEIDGAVPHRMPESRPKGEQLHRPEEPEEARAELDAIRDQIDADVFQNPGAGRDVPREGGRPVEVERAERVTAPERAHAGDVLSD